MVPRLRGVLGRFVYGDASVEEWAAQGGGDHGEPWTSFEQARQLGRAGRTAEAARIWQQIASTEGLESRQVLQAWHFLRHAGLVPPPEQARLALGVVAEMPVTGGHDLLAAYRDGSARYLNCSGSALALEDWSQTAIQTAIGTWIAIGQVIADAAGPVGTAIPAAAPGRPRAGHGIDPRRPPLRPGPRASTDGWATRRHVPQRRHRTTATADRAGHLTRRAVPSRHQRAPAVPAQDQAVESVPLWMPERRCRILWR